MSLKKSKHYYLIKKFFLIIVINLLWFTQGLADKKNIGNNISINIPNGYHYFDITLKQIASRFPSINVNDFINSDAGIGVNAKIIILANNIKTIKFLKDISTVTGLAKLEKEYMAPIKDLMEDSEFTNIIINYGKKKFPKVDWDNVTDEDFQTIWLTILSDKKFLKKINKYINPFIDKFNSEYKFDKTTFIYISDKKHKFVSELKNTSVNEFKNMVKETIKTMIKEDRSLKIYKNWKYEIGENPKGNLYLFSNDIEYMNKSPLWKNFNYLKASDTIITTENGKIFIASSQCYKECNTTNFLEIIGPTNLYKGSKTKVKNPINNSDIKTTNNSDIVTELERLNKLYKSGLLSIDEFKEAKKILLN